MKYIVIVSVLIIGFITFAFAANDCPRVKCSTSAPATKTGQCARVATENGVTMASLNRCDEGYTCPKASLLLGSNNFTLVANVTASCEATTVGAEADNNKLHGDKCSSNSNCASNSCVSEKCVGKAQDASCVSHAECAKGLACISQKCTAQRKTDEACTTDYDCVNDNGCRASKCVKYGSVNNLVELGLTESTALCSSNWVRLDGTKRVCDRATLKADQCKTDSDEKCNYTLSNGNNYVGGNCLCKYDENRTRMCPDLRMSSVDTTSDHTLRRFEQGVAWDTSIETCVSEVLSGKRDWYVKAWEASYEAIYGAIDWVKNLFGSSSSLTLSYVMMTLFAVALN